MDRKKLIYHKENIEKAQQEVERFIRLKNADHDDLIVYAILKGCVNAVGWMLDEMERSGKGKDMDSQTDADKKM